MSLSPKHLLGVFLIALSVLTLPQAIRQVISGRFPIEDYRDLLLGRAGGIKNLIALAS